MRMRGCDGVHPRMRYVWDIRDDVIWRVTLQIRSTVSTCVPVYGGHCTEGTRSLTFCSFCKNSTNMLMTKFGLFKL